MKLTSTAMDTAIRINITRCNFFITERKVRVKTETFPAIGLRLYFFEYHDPVMPPEPECIAHGDIDLLLPRLTQKDIQPARNSRIQFPGIDRRRDDPVADRIQTGNRL